MSSASLFSSLRKIIAWLLLTQMAFAVDPITHIVWITKENRSFDELYGMYPGVNGLTLSGGLPVGQHAASVNMPCPGAITAGTCTVFLVHSIPLDADSDPNHFRAGSLNEVDGGAMDGFTNGNAGSLNYTGNDGITTGQYAKIAYSYYTGADLPWYWSMAQQFGLADNFFSSMLGPSYPNHLYMTTAQANEVADNPDAKSGSAGATAASWTCQAAAAQQRTVTATNWTNTTPATVTAVNNLVGSGGNQSTIHVSAGSCVTATGLNNGNFAVSATGLSTTSFQVNFGSSVAYDNTCVLTNLNSGQPSGASGVSGLAPNVYITNSGTDPAIDPAIASATPTFTSMAINSPTTGLATYTSTASIAGSANAYITQLLTVTAMQNSTNNVTTQFITASTDKTVTVAMTTQVGGESGSTGAGQIAPGVVNDQGPGNAGYTVGICGGHCVGGTNQYQFCLNNSACPSSTCGSLTNPTYPTACTTANQATNCTGTSTCQFSIVPARQAGMLCPTNTGVNGSPVVTTIFDELTTASVTHKWYGPNSNQAGYIWVALAYNEQDIFGAEAANLKTVAQFYTDVNVGGSCNLPSVSYITPPMQPSDHPAVGNVVIAPNAQNMNVGEAWTESLVNAVGRSNCWGSTLIFLTWDDHGGFYDHVAPPTIDNVGLGIRVPTLCIGPYCKNTISHQQYEFASILKCIEQTFGVAAMTARDTNALSVCPVDNSGMVDRSQAAISPPRPAPRLGIMAHLNDPDVVTLAKELGRWIFPKHKEREIEEAKNFTPKLSEPVKCRDGYTPIAASYKGHPVEVCAMYEGMVHGQAYWDVMAEGQSYQDQDEPDE